MPCISQCVDSLGEALHRERLHLAPLRPRRALRIAARRPDRAPRSTCSARRMRDSHRCLNDHDAVFAQESPLIMDARRRPGRSCARRYSLEKQLGVGAFGEVWLAVTHGERRARGDQAALADGGDGAAGAAAGAAGDPRAAHRGAPPERRRAPPRPLAPERRRRHRRRRRRRAADRRGAGDGERQRRRPLRAARLRRDVHRAARLATCGSPLAVSPRDGASSTATSSRRMFASRATRRRRR